MRLEDAEEIVWQREWERLRSWGIAEVDPGWRQAYLGTMAGKCEVLGLLVRECLRTSPVYRVMERTVEWMERWL